MSYVDARGVKRLIKATGEKVQQASKKALSSTTKRRSDFYVTFDEVEAIPSDTAITFSSDGSFLLEETLVLEGQKAVETLAEEFRRSLNESTT